MKIPRLRLNYVAIVVVALLIAIVAGAVVARAASYDFRYGSGIYKGLVNDCVTSATVGLTKAGFEHVNSEEHTSNSSVYGQTGEYTGVVLCTKASSGTTYAELVFGPSGGQLETLFKALDTNFK